ncbi:hypothetical protein [Acidovorax sp. SUPP2539]|uniref:hypothetical protein n=1 Tax=Acidovorax sp. SUPP2539 TaxID=2920878 RepID=UPI0023DE23DF|nr:hypothetical protein [Acidovorax sp. SUPP2539]GKS92691.1 hypothetical protein AVTE2539_25020 [Acidovorax sp. SUPP2539]
MIEKMSDRQSLIRRRIIYPKYLSNLLKLLIFPISYRDLGTPDEAEKLRAQSQVFEGMASRTIELDFSIHEVERFKKVFNNLSVLNISRIYLWIEGSIDCGLVKIDSLADINVEYLLSSADWGIMGLLSEDMKDYLLLEINEYNDGLKVGLDAKGANWGAIDFSHIQ